MLKYTKMANELLEKSDKYAKTKGIYETSKNMKIKKVYLNEILDKLNNQELKMFDEIEVSGFLSKYACLCELNTFLPKKAVATNTQIVNNEKRNCFEIKSNSIPIVNIEDDNISDKEIMFLYQSDNPFDFKNDGLELIVDMNNQFIPIIVDKNIFYDYMEKNVNLICEIIPMDISLVEKYFNYQSMNYRKLAKLFINTDFEKYPFIVLKSSKFIKEELDNENINSKQKIQFAVEYQLHLNDSYPDTEQLIERAIIKAFGKYPYSLKTMPIKNDMGKIILSHMRKEKIQIASIDNYIGFYIETNLNDIQMYKQDIQYLKEKCNLFKKEIRGMKKIELIFISDYRKKIEF